MIATFPAASVVYGFVLT